ncbi:TIGR03089 family protein [Cellulomonas soli]
MPNPSIGSLLSALTHEPGRPRLTWYGPDSERVELSGAVLENWVNKTANLLVEEFDAGPGTRVLLNLPAHWRTVVWALAVWRVGACVVLDAPGAGAHPDVVVTDSPQAHPDADELVVVSLPALARRYDGTLPGGAVDAAQAVMTYGDTIGWVPAADRDAPALVGPLATAITHAHLVPVPSARRPRTHVPVGAGRTVADVLAAVLDAFAADGSAVLTCDMEPERLRRVLTQEGALDSP